MSTETKISLNKKTKILMIMQIIGGLAALVVLGTIHIWSPVCNQLLQLANGNMIPMKCNWTAYAATYLAILLLASSVISLATRNNAAIISLIIGIMFITITINTIGIGVCRSSTMPCIQTSIWLKGCGIVTIIASAVQLFVKE